MSEDIDRLKKVLEDVRVTNDTLVGQGEVMADVFTAITALDPTANPEAYGDLVAMCNEFLPEARRLHNAAMAYTLLVAQLCGKVGA